MRGKTKLFLFIFIIIFVFLSVQSAVFAEDVVYLARITTLDAVYDENLQRVEFCFDTTGTLYHEQSFSVTLSCTVFEDGKWTEGKIISTYFYDFDGCVVRGNRVEGFLNLGSEFYNGSRYKDFYLTVEGQKVYMGGDVESNIYDLDVKTVALTKKPVPTGAFFELGTEVSHAKLSVGESFTYRVYPKNINKNLSAGLSNFSFTLNYDPSVMVLEGIKGYYPTGTGWTFKASGFVSDGYRVSLEGQGIKDDGDVYVEFAFKTLKTANDTELYALDVCGGDAYGNDYKAETYVLLEARPVIVEEKTELGDVNGDDCADNTDAILILKYDAGITDEIADSGDVNADGYIDNTDAILILKYDAGIIDSLG